MATCETAVLPHRADGDKATLRLKAVPDVAVKPSPEELDNRRLRIEVGQLRRAMTTRPTIDQACGVLMASFGLSPEKAWDVLVSTSQNTNTKLHRLATDLVGTVRGERLPEAVQQQLVAAVARVGALPDPAA